LATSSIVRVVVVVAVALLLFLESPLKTQPAAWEFPTIGGIRSPAAPMESLHELSRSRKHLPYCDISRAQDNVYFGKRSDLARMNTTGCE
jgi:hypothetical protein